MSQNLETPLIGARLNVLVRAILDRIFAELQRQGFEDIRPAHQAVLRSLWPEGCRIGELAARVGITKASVVYLVNELEARGYVERLPDPRDSRATLVQYTTRGWKVHRVARAAVQRVQDEWTRAIGPNEMEAFLETLARLANRAVEESTAESNRKQRTTRLRGRPHRG